jgi:hypothetical protein
MYAFFGFRTKISKAASARTPTTRQQPSVAGVPATFPANPLPVSGTGLIMESPRPELFKFVIIVIILANYQYNKIPL